MTSEEIERHGDEAEAYMRNCTDAQIENIIADETERAKGQGEVAEIAAIMLLAAKNERRVRSWTPKSGRTT